MSNTSGSSKRAICYIVIAYVICLIGLSTYGHSISFFELVLDSDKKVDFDISFMASAIEDLIFFMILGIVVLAVTHRRPEDENLETRIGYLFSGANSSPDARQHALDIVSKHACISPKSEIIFTIESFDSSLSAFKVSTEYKFILANMYKDQPYKDKRVLLEISTDDVSVRDGVYGQVQAMSTTSQDALDCKEHIQAPVSIESLQFQKAIELEIPPDSMMQYYVRFWHYVRLGGNYEFGVNRYTKKLTIRMINASGIPVYFNKASDPKPTRHMLENNQNVSIYQGLAKPEDESIVIFLHDKLDG